MFADQVDPTRRKKETQILAGTEFIPINRRDFLMHIDPLLFIMIISYPAHIFNNMNRKEKKQAAPVFMLADIPKLASGPVRPVRT